MEEIKGIFTRDDGIMVRCIQKDGNVNITHSNGKYRLFFEKRTITIDYKSFKEDFPLKMDNKQIIRLLKSGGLHFEGETTEDSINFFNKLNHYQYKI